MYHPVHVKLPVAACNRRAVLAPSAAMPILERLSLFDRHARPAAPPALPPAKRAPRRARKKPPQAKLLALSEAELLLRQKIDDNLFDDDPGELLELPSLPSVVRLPVLNKPRSRTECANVPRPCPFVSCRYNLYLDVRNDGVLRVNFPDREPDEMTASCTLDLAVDGPRTLDAIAALMGMSKERARQLEASGLREVASRFTPEDVD